MKWQGVLKKVANKLILMIGNKLLPDKNIVVELFRGSQAIIKLLDELYLGAYRSASVPKKLQEIKNFLERCIVLFADATTADKYAIIKATLLNKGKPIPENDIWIAATANILNATLITTDNDFDHLQPDFINLIKV